MFRLFILILFGSLVSCNKHSSSDTPVYFKRMSDTMKVMLRKAKKERAVDLKQSLNIYKQTIQLGKTIGDDAGLVEAYRSGVFVAGALLNDAESALAISDEALAFAGKLGDANTLCDMYGMRAVVYQASGNTDSAIAVNKLAIKYMDEDTAPDSLKNWPLYLNIANLYSQLSNQKLAIEFTDKYLNEYVLKINDTLRLVSCYNNLGVYYTLLPDMDKAYENTYKAWHLYNAKPDAQKDPTIYAGMFAMYNNRDMYDSALFFCNKTIDLYLQNGNSQGLVDATNNLMEIATKSKSKDLATTILKSPAMIMAFHHFATEEDKLTLRSRKNFAEGQYSLYKLINDDKKAYQYLQVAYQLNASLRVQETNKAMEEYELNRKKVIQEKLLLERELEIEKKDNAILLLISLFVCVAALAITLVVWYNRKNVLQKKKIEFLEKQKEWEREKSQMEAQLEERNRISRELHDDLGASLTSIALASDLLRNNKGDKETAIDIISSTSTSSIDALNEIVWSLNSRNDSLMGLVAYIRKFASSFLGKAGMVLDIIEELPETDLPVSSSVRRSLYLTAKECLNNIVKHSDATNVQIVFSYSQPLFSMQIQDNGKGIDEKSFQLFAGNGLYNMKNNIENIGGNIKWTNANGTLVEISIALI